MRSGIHPDYVETTVLCGCGNTFRRAAPRRAARSWSRSARSATRSTPASRRSSTAAAAWPASRSATASARPRQDGRQGYRYGGRQLAVFPAPDLSRERRPGVGLRSGERPGIRVSPVSPGKSAKGGDMTDTRRRSTRCWPSMPTSSGSSPTRPCTPIKARPARSADGSRRSRRSSRRYRKLETARGDLEAARELGADDESFAAEVPELEAARRRAGDPADRPSRPARPA